MADVTSPTSPLIQLAAVTSPTTTPTTTSPSPNTDYIYRLLTHWGASDLTARTVQFVLVRPLEIVVILVLAYLIARLGSRIARRILRSVHDRVVTRTDSHRAAPRVATIGALVSSTWKIIVWIIAGLIVLETVGVNLTPLLAGAAVVGAALGFGAQSLVRDTLAGLFIVIEDQYGIGDVVQIGDTSGVVEELSIRVTRLRAVDGTVWYVANGEIRKVGNSSIQWSRALVDVVLPLGADVNRAIATMNDEVSTLASEPRWAPSCLEAPEVWGVESMDSSGQTVRLAVKTPVRDSARVARAIRTRVNARLASDGITTA